MWAWSRNSEWGRATEVSLELASPGRGLRTAVRAGLAPRLVPPRSFSWIEGLYGSEAQSAAWKGEATVTGRSSASLAKSRPAPSTVETVEVLAQEVGFKTKSDRST